MRAAAVLLALSGLGLASPGARAESVTFDWVQQSGNTTAAGTLTLTSALLTAADATGAAQFDITPSNIPAGETLLGEVSSFSFSMGGHTLSTSNMNGTSTGWTDGYPGEMVNILESTWSASSTFAGGNLQVVGNSTPTSYGDLVTATMGTQSATGEWELATPVPLPGSAGLFGVGIAGLIGFAALARRRPSFGSPAAPAAI